MSSLHRSSVFLPPDFCHQIAPVQLLIWFGVAVSDRLEGLLAVVVAVDVAVAAVAVVKASERMEDVH